MLLKRNASLSNITHVRVNRQQAVKTENVPTLLIADLMFHHYEFQQQ